TRMHGAAGPSLPVIDVWKEMTQAGASQRGVLQLQVHGGRATDALDLLKEMLDAGTALARVAYSHMIVAQLRCARLGRYSEVVLWSPRRSPQRGLTPWA
ncbi:hypothetical protein, partial [Brevundimonas sp.]|uniref:hypothetical protein n=1 Tax=Brevundimonas sp. TaxID=1871086 RepID=UPI00391C79B4